MPMDAQKLQDPETLSTFWVKNPNTNCKQDEQHKIIND